MPSFEDIWRTGALLCRNAAIAAALIASMAAAKAQLALPAPLPGTTEVYGTVLKTWAAKYNIKNALVVVRRQGKIVYRSALGGANASAPVHLASLSKAITGACVATLIRDRKLAFDTPLSTSLAKFFAAHGKPVDPRAAGVTIAQLLTHRAGFSGNADDNDVATVRRLVAYLRENSARQPPKPDLLVAAFKTPLPHQPGGDFVYSNTGYLVLGAIIEEAAGKPYLSYCREAVLAPLGVTGDLDPDWQVLGAYGGWRMAGEAYLPVLDLFAAEDQRLGSEVKKWMLSPQDKTISSDGQGLVRSWHQCSQSGCWRKQLALGFLAVQYDRRKRRNAASGLRHIRRTRKWRHLLVRPGHATRRGWSTASGTRPRTVRCVSRHQAMELRRL